jgi:hypothetical protein
MVSCGPGAVEESAPTGMSPSHLTGFHFNMYDSSTGTAGPESALRPLVTDGRLPGGLGKRQGNLLTAILRGIPLMGPDREVPFAEADVRACLAVFRPGAGPVATGRLNSLRPRLLDAVVGPAARAGGYLKGLPEGGVEPLLAAVDRSVQLPVVLRVVFGASVRVPLRALTYVLPAVAMAERIHAVSGTWPYVQAVYLGRLGAHINGLPHHEVQAEGRLLAGQLDSLLGTVYSHGRHGVYADHRLLPGDGRLRSVVAGLDQPGRQQILTRLRGKGGSLSDRQTLEYAAAHVLVHDTQDGIGTSLVAGEPAPDQQVVIDLGGLQERHFYAVRRIFAQQAGRPDGGAEPASVPGPLVLTRHSVPPYTMSRGGDFALRDFLAGTVPDLRKLPSAVRYDLGLLPASLSPALG